MERDRKTLGDEHSAVRVALLAARGAAAAQRVADGGKLDPIDRDALDELRKLFHEAAEAVRFVSSAGARGREPRQFAAVGLAIDVLPHAAEIEDRDALADAVRDVAIRLMEVHDHQDVAAARDLVPLLHELARMAGADAGTSGDMVATF